MTGRRLDLAGQEFGLLLVLGRAGRDGLHSTWHCQCQCSNEVVVRGNNLRTGNTKGCGCQRGGNRRTHGMTNSPEYGVWNMMVQRCINPKVESYRYYGALGVQVCERWRMSFENFYADMGPRPEGFSIDRSNPEGNYEPSNCRWTDAMTQRHNRRPVGMNK